MPITLVGSILRKLNYTLNSVVSHARGNQSTRDIKELCSVNMIAW
jgi:hypothetical protein